MPDTPETSRETFSDWTEQQFRVAFGLKFDPQFAPLTVWMERGGQQVLTEEERRIFGVLKERKRWVASECGELDQAK